MALSAGLACASAPGVAWADSTDSAGSGTSASESSGRTESADSGSGSSPAGPAGRNADADRPGKRWADRVRATGFGPRSAVGGRATRGEAGRADRAEGKDLVKLTLSRLAKQAGLGATESPADPENEPDAPQTRGFDADAEVTHAEVTLAEVAGTPPSTIELPSPPESGDLPESPLPGDLPGTAPVLPEPAAAEPDRTIGLPLTTKTARNDPDFTAPLAGLGRAAGQQLGAAVAPRTSLDRLQAGVLARVPADAVDSIGAPAASTAALDVVSPDAVVTTTPTPPQPLSPVAQLLQLPGRVVNAVLEALDFTSAANSPTLPVSLTPINDLIFGAFREVERLLGLHQPPPPQPAVPTLTYDGPTDRPTPTVAQFLNASTAAYVLGSTPGDLKPFVVDGHQMSSTNILSGMVGKAWVTPEGQIIIAYQGTTGGSHLLFNPLIVIPQVIADLQVVFTGTTPLAFHDAYDFAQEVRAEAALQGYSDDDIFVTGHSLGGWEAQYVAQQTGLSGIGFEAPGINTTVPGNGADSMFVNIGTYGSSALYMSTDLPGLQPFMPPYEPGGGSKPHYGPIVMVGDPAAMTPLYNAAALWGKSPLGSAIFLVDYLMNFFQYHLPGVQAYHLDITSDPGVVPFLGTKRGPVHTGYGDMTIPELMAAASDDGILFQP